MKTTTNTEKPLRIVELNIENVKRLHAVHIQPEGNSVVLGGNNAQGKSSVLDAIMMALSGAKCAKPVHGDEDKGKVVVDLGEIVVTRTFTASGGGALTVTAADGTKFSSPQKMLDSLLGEIAFDPLAFTRMKPKEQLETLRAVTGINTAMMDAARQTAYDQRTVVNRKMDELRAQIAAMPLHEGTPDEEADPNEILARLKKATDANMERERFIESGKRAADELVRLDTEIIELTNRLATMTEDRQKKAVALAMMRTQAEHMTLADTAAISEQLTQVTEINKRVREHRTRQDAEDALTTHVGKSAELTQKLADIDEKKRAKLAAVKYPVAGLALADDGITYNGIPFTQASAAEQLRVSVGIGLASNPRLRVLLVRDAALLDPASLAMMQAMADDAEAQVWIERVGKGDECTIIIEDGRVEK